MRKIATVLLIGAAALSAGLASAQGMMAGGGMANGAGMLVVADDGSLIATQLGVSMMGGPGGGGQGNRRAVVNVAVNGVARWSFQVDQGWPMMAASQGDLVLVVVVNNAWMWRSMSGMGWYPWGDPPQGGEQEDAVLVGVDLATGAQRWQTTLPGDMASLPQFSADGSRLYLTTTDFGPGGMVSGGQMGQGEAGGWATQMGNTVVALDRAGTILWTLDLASSGGMMP